MTTWIDLELRKKYTRKSFYSEATKARDTFAPYGVWQETEKDLVWSHRSSLGEVRFYINGGDKQGWIKVYCPYHPSEEARTLGAFVEWLRCRVPHAVRGIEIRF